MLKVEKRKLYDILQSFNIYIYRILLAFGCHADTSGLLYSVRNFPEPNELFDPT